MQDLGFGGSGMGAQGPESPQELLMASVSSLAISSRAGLVPWGQCGVFAGTGLHRGVGMAPGCRPLGVSSGPAKGGCPDSLQYIPFLQYQLKGCLLFITRDPHWYGFFIEKI